MILPQREDLPYLCVLIHPPLLSFHLLVILLSSSLVTSQTVGLNTHKEGSEERMRPTGERERTWRLPNWGEMMMRVVSDEKFFQFLRGWSLHTFFSQLDARKRDSQLIVYCLYVMCVWSRKAWGNKKNSFISIVRVMYPFAFMTIIETLDSVIKWGTVSTSRKEMVTVDSRPMRETVRQWMTREKGGLLGIAVILLRERDFVPLIHSVSLFPVFVSSLRGGKGVLLLDCVYRVSHNLTKATNLNSHHHWCV